VGDQRNNMMYPKPIKQERPVKRMKRTAMKQSTRSRRRQQCEVEWARAVKERDGKTCQRCGRRNFLNRRVHAHHIAPRSHRPDLIFVLSNGITLCGDCHLWVHTNPQEAIKAGLLATEAYEHPEPGSGSHLGE
jgi:5-methylcytosine-specific restriction endonuclease McrA